jgi:hypothetical protein
MANQRDKRRSTTDRLFARQDESPGLREESVAGGSKVLRGQLADQALDVLGARAFTFDRSVIVSSDFDTSAVEDQALLAHEQYHAMYGDGGGGGGGSNYRDAEEIAARAVERAVLSRSAKGGYEAGGGGGVRAVGGHGHSHIAGDSAGGGTNAGAQDLSQDQTRDAKKDKPDSDRGYSALRQSGYSHYEVVALLTKKVMQAKEEAQRSHIARFGDVKGTL